MDVAEGEDPRNVITLNLHNQRLGRISNLEACKKLRQLDLSFNRLPRIEGYATAPLFQTTGSWVYMRSPPAFVNVLLDLRNAKICASSRRITTKLKLSRVRWHLLLRVFVNCVQNAMPKDLLKTPENQLHPPYLVAYPLEKEVSKTVKQLVLSKNKIAVIEGVAKFTGLANLDVSYNELDKMTGLATLINLEELSLAGNNISVIEGINNCQKLEDLNLCDNNLSTLKGVSRLPMLDCLRVDGNQLRSLEGLNKPLNELTELYIARNFLTSLEGLGKSCPNLEILDAAENKLASVKRLHVALGSLAKLKELRLTGNPLVAANAGTYRQRVASALKQIEYLDDELVTETEQTPASEGEFPHLRTLKP
eukprot:1893426-Pyramimonas_sp.AAC.2